MTTAGFAPPAVSLRGVLLLVPPLCCLLNALACTSHTTESLFTGDQQALSQLVPVDQFPAGFHLLFAGAIESETVKGLSATYQHADGNRITISVVNAADAVEARREFDLRLGMSKSLPYGSANASGAVGGLVAGCEPRLAVPDDNACALKPAASLNVGTNSAALETAAPVQGKHWTIDIFQRADLVLASKIEQVEDSRVQVDRAAIVHELDRRAKRAVED